MRCDKNTQFFIKTKTKLLCRSAYFMTCKRKNFNNSKSHIDIVIENSRYSIAGNIGEGTLRQSEMLKVSVLCSIDGVLEILGICQYLPFSPYNHKNNLLINSETLHTKSQQRRSKPLIHLR